MTRSHPKILALCFALAWLVLGAPGACAVSITDFAPTNGAPGTTVSITGTGFLTATVVKFGNSSPASFDILNDTHINAVVPADAVTGVISVTFNVGTLSSQKPFTVAPRVDSFTPVVGTPGTQVTVNGANFNPTAGQTVVRFGGVAATVVNVTAPNQLVATVPAGAVTGPLSVATPIGTNLTTTNFVVSGTAIITGFSPAIGPTGSVVVISGGDFSTTTAVQFNGTNATFTVTAPSQISAKVPATATTGPISIVTPSGTATTTSNFVVSGLAPIITGFAPIGGKPGDPIVLTGISFTGATNVTFNGSNAQFGVTSDTQISAIVPAGATAGPISVFNSAGSSSSGSNFIIGPFITGFSPVSVQVGSQVVVDGLNFLDVTNVAFASAAGGFTNATFNIVAATQLRATVPVGATNGPLQIISPSGTNVSSSNLTVFVLAPVINSFTPTNGLPNSFVTIDGANFLGATNVTFNGVSAAFNVTADTQITATVPASASTGPISVSTPGGSVTSSVSFYLAPRLTTFSPATGPVATVVTLNGTNLSDVVSVTFAGTNSTTVAAPVSSISATQLVVLVPTNAVSGLVTVITPGGVITSTNTFTVTPRVDSFAPLLGPVGTTVTVNGYNFTGTTTVQFNGVTAGFSSLTDTQLVTAVPFGASTGPLTVTTTDGIGAGPVNFIVTTRPDLAVLQTNSPTIVPFASNVTVTVTITNKGPSIASSVVFTDTLPFGYTFISANSTRGVVSFASGVLTCPIGALTNGQAEIVTIVMNAGINGLGENRASVTLAESDADSSNNFTSLYVPVITTAERTLTYDFVAGMPFFAVHWPVSAVTFTLEFNTNFLVTNNVWNVASPGPVRVTNNLGIFNYVTNDTTLPGKFFRLRAP